jgi:iron(III) transport system ATP-binding protein
VAQLILDNISKRFDGTGRAAVETVTLKVREGGLLALLGPSGCGKTTVLRMIAGFEAPTGGTIRIGERCLASDDTMVAPEHRNMAMVFQSYALWPHMSVAENVGYPLKVRGLGAEERRSRVASALSAVRLDAYADRRPADLSGGQRQRVALARCLVTDPDVVLLDEPLANLDRHLRQEMEETFREFHQRSGATMIYVTHDQAEAMALATDVAVMSEGRLLQVATPEEIYARPEGRLVGSLIGQGAILSLPSPGGDHRVLDRETMHRMLEKDGGEVVDILVRPQDVEIGAGGIAARVLSALFEGERYAVKLSLPDGQVVRAFSRVPVKVGERVPLILHHGWRL